MKLERIDDIDPDEEHRCRFLNEKCTNVAALQKLEPLELHLKWCQNCLMGKLIEELRRLRVTGPQP